jgi:hypothetical protein
MQPLERHKNGGENLKTFFHHNFRWEKDNKIEVIKGIHARQIISLLETKIYD